MHTQRSTRLTSGKLALLVLCVLYGALACAIQPRQDVEPHEWWHERGPVVPHSSFPDDCSLCHVGERWSELRDDFEFDHGAETGVVLEGSHADAECLRCHNDRGPVALFAARGCAGCHENVHRGQLGVNCQDCHDQSTWRPREQIEMHNRTRLPLVGAHAGTPCWACHDGAQVGDFAYEDPACIACHRDDLARATNPDHQAQGWVVNCDRCHIPTTWTGGGFNHASFPLTGQHAVADCAQCHVGGVYAGTPNQCVDCHLAEYQATTDPDHQAVPISTQCQQCHNTSSWFGASFPHTGITTGCVACHLPEYQATTDPNHTAAGFPTSCENCHNTVNWNNASFAHTFPITSGKHKNFSCSDCHLNPGNFTQFSCTHCHEHSQSEMDDEHSGVGGYVWSSPACFMCHPDGKER